MQVFVKPFPMPHSMWKPCKCRSFNLKKSALLQSIGYDGKKKACSYVDDGCSYWQLAAKSICFQMKSTVFEQLLILVEQQGKKSF